MMGNDLSSLLSLSPFSPVSSLTSSSGTSEDLDHQEIQVALNDAKVATRNKIRSRFHSSSDLIHRLFVCISGRVFYFLGIFVTKLSISYNAIYLFVICLFVIQVLLINCRQTMLATFAASSRLYLKSWQLSLSKETTIHKRKVRNMV